MRTEHIASNEISIDFVIKRDEMNIQVQSDEGGKMKLYFVILVLPALVLSMSSQMHFMRKGKRIHLPLQRTKVIALNCLRRKQCHDTSLIAQVPVYLQSGREMVKEESVNTPASYVDLNKEDGFIYDGNVFFLKPLPSKRRLIIQELRPMLLLEAEDKSFEMLKAADESNKGVRNSLFKRTVRIDSRPNRNFLLDPSSQNAKSSLTGERGDKKYSKEDGTISEVRTDYPPDENSLGFPSRKYGINEDPLLLYDEQVK